MCIRDRPRGAASTEGQGSVDFEAMQAWGADRAICAGGARRARPAEPSAARGHRHQQGGLFMTLTDLSAIRTTDITKTFADRTAVDSLNLSIEPSRRASCSPC